MNKMICVTGKGKLSLRPDLIDLHLSENDVVLVPLSRLDLCHQRRFFVPLASL